MSDFKAQVQDVLKQVEDKKREERRESTKYGAKIESEGNDGK
ncbi:hypothetical protein [Halomonas sp.]